MAFPWEGEDLVGSFKALLLNKIFGRCLTITVETKLQVKDSFVRSAHYEIGKTTGKQVSQSPCSLQ